MRTLIACLALIGVGCSNLDESKETVDGDVCLTNYVDQWVIVSDSSQEKDVTKSSTDERGCELVVTTHYVTTGAFIGVSGLPFWYFAAQCQWDACGGPLKTSEVAVDPVDDSH